MADHSNSERHQPSEFRTCSEFEPPLYSTNISVSVCATEVCQTQKIKIAAIKCKCMAEI